jgi:DnaK suppressor protein
MIIECTGNAEPAKQKGEKNTQGSIKLVEHEPNHRDLFGKGIRKEVTMNAIKNEEFYNKLKNRRGEIIRTLEHVQKEQRTVDENKEWIDRAAYESRCHLLDSLADWYVHETTRIDDALTRITEGRYGVCLGCHEPIEPHRLETAPDAAFCADCQKIREELTDS